MNIALIGYGKMGKAIEEIALQRGHTIALKIDVDNADQFTKANLDKTDVAIEFTGPHSAFDNVKKLMQFGTRTVCGSTGWLEKIEEIRNDCKKNNTAFIYASNFSVGVNIFFEGCIIKRNRQVKNILSGCTHRCPPWIICISRTYAIFTTSIFY